MKQVTAQDVDQLRESNPDAVVIDVLATDSYERRHLPGAINIPSDAPDFAKRVETALPGKDTPVVVYCASLDCQRSPTAARNLEELGYTDVRDFEQGLKGWEEAGFRFEGTGQPRRVEKRAGVEERPSAPEATEATDVQTPQ